MLITNRSRANVIKTPHGSEIRPLIDQTTAPIRLCSLAEEVLPPGARVEPHHHQVTEEIYYILRGAGEMEIDGERQKVEAGAAIYIPIGSRHSLINTGAEDMTLLLVCGPAYSREDHLFEPSASAILKTES